MKHGSYLEAPAVNQSYAKGLSYWQHRVIRRFAQRQLNERTDLAALARAKADIRAMVERDFNRKQARGRKRHARFLEDHSQTTTVHGEVREQQTSDISLSIATPDAVAPISQSTPVATDVADDALPLFESSLDLPRLTSSTSARAANASDETAP